MNPTRSNVLLLVHVVWATKRRAPLLGAHNDDLLVTLLPSTMPEQSGHLRALGVAPDHVHVLIEVAATLRLSDLVQSMKGVAARRWHQQPPDGVLLRWQDGYWARSVSPSHTEALDRYIRNQRAHHATPQPPESWELDFI